MQLLASLDEIKAACRSAASTGTLGLVPTMGALHEGHLSLVRRACEECDQVAVSIFVNPLQFGEAIDFERYHRPLDADAAMLADAGAHIVAALQEQEMYPPGYITKVTMGPELTRSLEGAARPGHFDGVLTVVAKLFGIANPTRAYFGRKDFQQAVVVRRLIRDLDLPIELVVCDILRDDDGMAMSSRNAFLSPSGRQRGLSLVAALSAVEQLFAAGETSVPALEEAMQTVLRAGLGCSPDYANIVDPDDMSSPPKARLGDVAVVAGPVAGPEGDVRLLDNHVLGSALLGSPSPPGSAARPTPRA